MLSRLLSLIAEDVDVPSRLVSDEGNVVAALLLANLLNLLDVLLGEIDLLEVGGDALGSDGLGDDTVTTDLSPGEARGLNISKRFSGVRIALQNLLACRRFQLIFAQLEINIYLLRDDHIGRYTF